MEHLLQVESIITPCCSKSHITYILYLPKESRKIYIEFSYEPKCMDDKDASEEIIKEALSRYINKEDMMQYAANWKCYLPLKNLITLSFDDNSGFRGCAHRHDHKQKLIISEHSASPGLVPGLIPPGHFRITLSTHVVVTDTCRYCLNVWEGGEILG